jgi:hypothetical protein
MGVVERRRMLIFITTRGHEYTVKAFVEQTTGVPTPPAIVGTYDQLFRADRALRGTYIFTDIERLYPWEARLAADMYRSLESAGLRCLNDPARVLTRYALLRTLHREGINPFDVYRAEDRPSPKRFPVFVRDEQDHSLPFGGLLSSQEELDSHLDDMIDGGTPLRGYVVIEFCAEPVCEGVWRKFGSFCIGRRFHVHHHVTEDSWLVKYGRPDISPEWLYLDEHGAVTENRCPDPVIRAFHLAGIDYGRADHTKVNGSEVVYEINTNPQIGSLQPQPHPIREKTLAHSRRAMAANLFAIDSGDPTRVELVPSERVCQYRAHVGSDPFPRQLLPAYRP